MEDLYIPEKEGVPGLGWHPYIEGQAEKGHLLVRGSSFGYDIHEHLSPMYEWLEVFFSKPAPSLLVDFEVPYFNTSYSRRYLELIRALLVYQKESQGKIKIVWHIDAEDQDMKEEVEDLLMDSDLEYAIIPQDNPQESDE